jgi:hypothetical protein
VARRPASAADGRRLLSAGRQYWLSRLTVHSTYAGGLLGPALVVGDGLGLMTGQLPWPLGRKIAARQ